MKNKTDMKLLKVSFFCFGMMSASFLLMAPWSDFWEEQRTISVLSGILFWTFLIAGTLLQIIVSGRCRGLRRREQKNNGRSRHIGLFQFFSGKVGKIADGGMIFGAIGLALSSWLTQGIGVICYVFLFVTVLFFTAHCIFNGKNYYYLTHTESKKQKPGRYIAR